MGPMTRRPRLNRRKVAAWSAATLAGLMVWSLVAAPASIGDQPAVVEPPTLNAYSSFGDASAIQSYFDHQVTLTPAGPTVAHSQSDVGYGPVASGTAWFEENGVVNGLNGTTTGNKVPTEVSAKQPGGLSEDKFSLAGGPIGNDPTLRVAGGQAFAKAEYSDSPRGYANSYVGNVALLPAPGGQANPPGNYDPNQTFPGGPGGSPVPDPAPNSQMAIVSIGSIASSSESVREDNLVKSNAVAEINGINIGNRTSDGRCTNCFTIDFVRAEAYAASSGQPKGSQAANRVTIGRACRRAQQSALPVYSPDADTTKEADTCIGGASGLQSLPEFEQFNDLFANPAWSEVGPYTVGIRIHAGTTHQDPARPDKTSAPPEDACRNYAYPDRSEGATKIGKCEAHGATTGPDRDSGQYAKAVAEGLEIEIYTITTSQVLDAVEQSPANDVIKAIDEDHNTPGVQITVGPTGKQTIPTQAVRTMRRLTLALGIAQASVTARPGTGEIDYGDQDNNGPTIPEIKIPEIHIPEFNIPPSSGGQTIVGGTTIVNRGMGAGPLRLKINWASMRIKPWAAEDMATGIFGGAVLLGMAWLARKRLLHR